MSVSPVENSAAFGIKDRYLTSRAYRSDALSAFDNANNTESLRVRSFTDRSTVGPFCFRKSNTYFMSHLPACLGLGGQRLNAPFISRETRGCLPTWNPSTGVSSRNGGSVNIQDAILLSLVKLIRKEFQNIHFL